MRKLAVAAGIVAIAAVIALVAVHRDTSPRHRSAGTSAGPTVTTATTTATVAAPDFNNTTYPAGTCDSDASFAVRDGQTQVRDAVNDYPQTSVSTVVPATLDPQGPPAFVVLLACRRAMTDHGTEAQLWAARSGAYKMITKVPSVGATYGTSSPAGYTSFIMRVTAPNNRLAVTEAVYESMDANCCPSTTVRSSYRLDGDRLVLDGDRTVLAITNPNRQTDADNRITSVCSTDANGICPQYPFVSVLNGLAHGFNVDAVATPEAVQTLKQLRLDGATFDVRRCSGDIDHQTCAVLAKTSAGSRSITMTAGTADDRRSSPDVVDTSGQPVSGLAPWIVTSASVA